MRKAFIKFIHSPFFLPTASLLPILFATIIFLFLKNTSTEKVLMQQSIDNSILARDIEKLKVEFETLKKTDQIKRNDELQATIKSIQTTYSQTVTAYENLLDLPPTTKGLPNYRKSFTKILKYLSDKNYASGTAELTALKGAIDKEKAALLVAAGGIDTTNLAKSTTPPGNGYQRQVAEVNGASYIVDIVAGNLSSTRVVVDVASDSDCRDNCPTLSLGSFISRNGAYAGVNGSYFCPADYPSCAGKTNSFDTLAMGKNKHYHNSDNNVYSTVPLVVFGSGFIRFVGQSSGWGRDTGVDGVLANQPLLVSGGNSVFGGDGDPKKGSRGNRSFVANKGNVAYIGVVRNATVAEASLVLKAMGMENALNLDSGGSTALWAGGGYKTGPGRNIPNAILFVNK